MAKKWRSENLLELFTLHLCFQPSQIVLEIPFNHWSHEKIRETIECPFLFFCLHSFLKHFSVRFENSIRGVEFFSLFILF